MDRNESNDELVKKHPEVVLYRNTSLVLAILWIIAVMIMAGFDPLLSVIFLCVFPLCLLFLWLGYLGKKRDIRKQLEQEKAVNGHPHGSTSHAAPAAAKASQKSALDDPVVKGAASYAVGKAVLDTASKATGKLAESPYTKKRASATPTTTRVASKYVGKMGKAHKCCGSCAYWAGERELDAANHGRIANIISKAGKCTCKQSPKCRLDMTFSGTCTTWDKWSDLK